MGGATGEAFVNTLLGTGLRPAAILAREAIQNSVDASTDTSKVKVSFRRVTLNGSEKKQFMAELGFDVTFKKRKKELELQQDNCLQSDKTDEPLHLLYVEDYNTHGLYGRPHDSKSHFFRLLLSLGDGSKSRDKGGSGGSYGYGKSVYSANSRIHTIVAYSVFDSQKDGSKNHARLMGCGYFNTHEVDGVSYSGRAWFGVPSSEGQDIVEPLHDNQAHDLASKLGFEQRSRVETGTSILIVDCPVECEDLRSSLEDWWWPRILDESTGLDIVLKEQGKVVSPPRPRTREDLKPFIKCYEMAIGRAVPAGKHDKAGSLNRLDDVELGSYGYTILNEKEEVDQKLQDKINRVALIRTPRMVVSYLEVGSSLPLSCVGTFVAAENIDKPLKISEPASHDKWDPTSSRLNNLSENNREVVKAVLNRLKSGLRRFSNEAAPPTPKQDLRLRLLERLLGALFRPPSSSGGGGGGVPADPIEIKFVEQPHSVVDGDGLSTRGKFQLALAGDADKDEIDALLSVQCLVVEDEGISREDPISLSVTSEDVEFVVDKENPSKGRLKLQKSISPVFTFKTKKYPTDWTAQVRIGVEEL